MQQRLPLAPPAAERGGVEVKGRRTLAPASLLFLPWQRPSMAMALQLAGCTVVLRLQLQVTGLASCHACSIDPLFFLTSSLLACLPAFREVDHWPIRKWGQFIDFGFGVW